MYHNASTPAKIETPSVDMMNAAGIQSDFWLQLVALLGCWLTCVWFHWGNDGIWFQGDSPRHALNAVFFLDLAKEGIWNPIEYAHRYYARYPAINPQRYPPLFYALLAPSYAVFGVSGFVAKCLVQSFALMLGIYTLVGIRRWITPKAGIVAGLVLLMPGTMRWSGAVMLNLPALALGVACLFHLRIVLEHPDNRRTSKHFCIAVVFAALSILMHPTVGVVIPIAGLWLLLDRRWRPFVNLQAIFVILSSTLICGFVYWMLYSMSSAQFAQAASSKARVASVLWPTFYLQATPDLIGTWTLPVILLGLVCSFKPARFRRDSVRLVLATLLALSLLHCIWAKDERYFLWACPAATWLIAHAFVAISSIEAFCRNKQLALAISAGLLMTLTTYLIAISQDDPPGSVNSLSKVAKEVAKIAAGEPILYHGTHDGSFVFYIRSIDEQFQQQVVLVRKLPTRPGQSVEKNVLSWRRRKPKDETINETNLRNQIARTRCRWLLLEKTTNSKKDKLANVINQLANQNGYQLEKTFKVAIKKGTRKIELYRIRPDETGDIDLPALPTPMAIDGITYQPVSPRTL